MSDDLSKVDWGKPIEAWNPITNETVPMQLEEFVGSSPVTEDCPDPSTSNTWWRQDGANRCVGSPWRIRNVVKHVQPDIGILMTDPIAKRMEALEAILQSLAFFYAGAERGSVTSFTVNGQLVRDIEDAIVALLPEPVDADLVEARKVVRENNRMASYNYEDGSFDATPIVQCALAAIRRGRALERDSREG